MAAEANARNSQGEKPESGSGDNILVSVSRDGDLAQKITCMSSGTITVFGGSQDNPMFLGKLEIKRNGRRYKVRFQADRRKVSTFNGNSGTDKEGED